MIFPSTVRSKLREIMNKDSWILANPVEDDSLQLRIDKTASLLKEVLPIKDQAKQFAEVLSLLVELQMFRSKYPERITALAEPSDSQIPLRLSDGGEELSWLIPYTRTT